MHPHRNTARSTVRKAVLRSIADVSKPLSPSRGSSSLLTQKYAQRLRLLLLLLLLLPLASKPTVAPTNHCPGGGTSEGDGEADAGGGGNGDFFGSLISSATELTAGLAKQAESLADRALGEFQNEQRKFVNSKSKGGKQLPPWVGMQNEGELREKILALSADKRNFVRDPPAGQSSSIVLKESMGMALAILEEDPALEEMRFKLVPKDCTEDRFWGNYLYRVSLIVQSAGIASMAADTDGDGSNEGGGGSTGASAGGATAPTPPPVVETVDAADIGGPSMLSGVDPAEAEGDLSDHELEEFEDDGAAAAATAALSVDLSALGANVPASPVDEDANGEPVGGDDGAGAAVAGEEGDVDDEAPAAAAAETASSPAPATDAPSPDDDWEEELANELDEFELVEGDEAELEGADLDDLEGMLDGIEDD